MYSIWPGHIVDFTFSSFKNFFHVVKFLSGQTLWHWESSFQSAFIVIYKSRPIYMIQPHLSTPPPPCFMVSTTIHGEHAGLLWLRQNYFVSSDKRMCCQYSSGFWLCCLSKVILAVLGALVIILCVWKFISCNVLHAVWSVTNFYR